MCITTLILAGWRICWIEVDGLRRALPPACAAWEMAGGFYAGAFGAGCLAGKCFRRFFGVGKLRSFMQHSAKSRMIMRWV